MMNITATGKPKSSLSPMNCARSGSLASGPEVFTTETLADIIDKQREIHDLQPHHELRVRDSATPRS